MQDRESGLRAAIALHSTRLGPGAGGVRRVAYASEDEAVADVLRLAEAMTTKCALAELPAGGAKAVVLDRPGLDARAAYRALGRAVERLGGRYLAGPDVGTGEAEMAALRECTRFANPVENDPGRATAAGVLAGLKGTLRVLDGDASVAGRSFLVQGLGAVGMAVARALLDGGAVVLATDVRAEARAEAARAGARVVAPEDALATACDVLVPCALGGVLSADVARRAPFRAACGSANNALASPEAGRAFHERGVLVAPDVVVSAGAVIEGVLTTRHGRSRDVLADVARRVAAIEPRVERVLRESRERDEPPHAVAAREAAARLARSSDG